MGLPVALLIIALYKTSIISETKLSAHGIETTYISTPSIHSVQSTTVGVNPRDVFLWGGAQSSVWNWGLFELMEVFYSFWRWNTEASQLLI